MAQAAAQQQAGDFPGAEAAYQRILAANDKHAGALASLGMLHLQQGRLEKAMRLIDRSLEINLDQPYLHMARGTVLQDLQRLDEAVASYDRAIALNPDLFEAWVNRGTALMDLGRMDIAMASFDSAILLRPQLAELYFNRGIVLHALGHPDEAVNSYERAIALKPGYADAYYNRGIAHQSLERLEDAVDSYNHAIALRPDFASAYCNRGVAYQGLGRGGEALASLDRAIGLKPDYAVACYNRGNILRSLNRPDEALASYDRAISLDADYAEAHYNRGNVLQEQGRYDEALASYDRMMVINPDLHFALGDWLYCMMSCCSWDRYETACAAIFSRIENGGQASAPFAILSTPAGLDQQQRCAQIYTRAKYPGTSIGARLTMRYKHDRIRIGYFSSDYRDHPVSHLIRQLVKLHDRSGFQVYGFSFGPSTRDIWRRQLEQAFDHFHDVRGWTDEEVAALVRDLEIDVAIDLNGHTQNARTGVFALHCAPVQVQYLGYVGTMGADYIDYLIGDRVVIPEHDRHFYCEKLVYLPHSYQVNDSTKMISDHCFSRAETGLPDDAFVFCCFNNNFKITPDVFDVWMRLLNKVDGSVLWLYEGNPTVGTNLRSEAGKRNVDPERLIFAPRLGLADHLARYRLADLFLDTFYYNAGATASDALWAGLPVLTCLGNTYAGRMGASLLNAIGLPELITRNPAEYESLARKLATRPEWLVTIRHKLAANISTQPLFDTTLFTHHLETAYVKMLERYHAGLAPEHIVLDA